jgi:diaminohydroxyphosphoribosylaminopyrimidine deaminase/5-amino-6-(5-phosphoribosylamino)uracil reductase
MVRSAAGDVVAVTTSAASAERRRALEAAGVEVAVLNGPGGRADLAGAIDWLGRRNHLSLMIEAGSKLNWTALETGVVDRILFYYGPKILGGLEALPLAGGIGRRRRVDAIRVHNVTIHPIPPDEFAIEGYVHRDH